MAGEGQMLQASREEKQWTFTDAEEITKIRVRYIKALEEENYDILPGTTYVKGYLRTYAKQLGLNSDEIIALYNASATPVVIPFHELPKTLVKVRPIWVRPAVIGSVAILALVLVIAIALSQPGKELVDSPYTPAALPIAPQTDAVEPAPSIPVVPKPEPEKVEVATQEGLTAELVFTQLCWIEVRVDGQPSWQGTFKPGTSKEVKGIDKIELVTIGNAGGLSVTLNNKALPSLGKSGAIVNNVVLTKDYLEQL